MVTTGVANDKVLRQLQALLDKEASLRGTAEPHNQHEAEATAQAVQRLLLRHHLAMSDVAYIMEARRNPVGAEEFNPAEHGVAGARYRVPWQEQLAATVAQAHLCALLVVPGSNRVLFVGREQDRRVAATAFGLLLRFGAVRSQEYAGAVVGRGAGRATPEREQRLRRAAWLRGYNLRIAERYRELERRMVQQAMEQNNALARLPGGTGISTGALARRLTNARAEAEAWVQAQVGSDPATALPTDPVDDVAALHAGFTAGGEPALGAKGAVAAG